MKITKQKGSYVIVYFLTHPTKISIGRLGAYVFPAGFYFYCGSAHGGGGLASRVHRHLQSSAKHFWHIDYFKQYAQPKRVWYTTSISMNECSLVKILIEDNQTESLIADFGASDCKAGCASHFLHTESGKDLNLIYKLLKRKISGLKQEEIVKPG